MKDEVNEFLSQVKGEAKGDPFIPDESDPLADSLNGGTKVPDAKDEGDKAIPYHKDPKVQRFIEKEIAKRIKDVKPAEVQKLASDAGMGTDELTETLIEIIGNDTPQKVAAVKKFRSQLEVLKKSGAEEALGQLEQRAQAERAQETEAMEELTTAFENIEDEFGVDLTSNSAMAQKERNEFIDFVKRVSPKDANGDVSQYPDFGETYKLFKSTQKPASNSRAKDLASRSMNRSADAGSAPTSGKTWKDIDRIFSKL